MSSQRFNSVLALWCAYVLALTALTGCASSKVGPIGTPSFDSALRPSVLRPDEQLRFSSASEWLPNVSDFDDLIRRAGAGRFSEVAINQGVLILTDERLVFVEYQPKSKTYSSRLSLRFREILSASLTSHGKGRAIALEFDDHSSHLFSAIGQNGIMMNQAETERAFQIVDHAVSQARADAAQQGNGADGP